MNKKILTIIIIIVIVAGAGYLIANRQTSSTINTGSHFQVSASFYPLYFFSSQIADGLATTINITPAGAEPHDYEPTPQDIANIEVGKLLVINGAGLEPWADRLTPELESKGITVINASSGVTLLPKPAGAEEITTPFDPHAWVNPITAKKEVENILEGFKKADPEHATTYAERADALETKLDALDKDFQAGLAHCQQTSFVTSHAAFGYLAQQYHLTQIPIAGLSPDAEPSAQQVAQIADFAKSHHIKYIFFESLVSPKLSETIAREVGAKTLVLDPLEGLTADEVTAGDDYFSIMHNNLQNLRTALQCQ